MTYDKVFVPLLRDEKTWDRCSKILFLDEHFLAGKSNNVLNKLEYDVLRNDLQIKHDEIDSLSYRICEVLTRELNNFHSTNFPVWYWHSFMGRWLNHFIFSVYDKQSRIEKILKLSSDSDVVFQNFKCNNVIARNFEEFYSDELAFDCHYLQIYSELLDYYNCKRGDVFTSKELSYSNSIKQSKRSRFKNLLYTSTGIADIFKRIMHKVSMCSRLLFVRKTPEILFASVDFPTDMVEDIVIKSHGKIQPVYLAASFSETYTISTEIRQRMKNILYQHFSSDDREWVKFMCTILTFHVPFCYIEGYENLISEIPPIVFNSTVKGILTTTGFYSTFIQLAALTAKVQNGTKMLAMQHGGDYGPIKYVDQYDYCWDDVFYIWGTWISDYQYKNGTIKNAPSAKFLRYKNNHKLNVVDGILFVGTSIFMHNDFEQFYSCRMDKRTYISRQIKIFNNLSVVLHKHLILRNYYVEYGWEINTIIQKKFPDIFIEHGYSHTCFYDRLLSCKMFIVDHISTTWLEALYLNKPFIIVVNLDAYRFNKSEICYFQKMQDVGIIRDIDTVNEIENIYYDVEKWWNAPERQAVIQEIRARYCFGQDMSEEDMVSWWVNELLT